jgi:hypothetical protein
MFSRFAVKLAAVNVMTPTDLVNYCKASFTPTPYIEWIFKVLYWKGFYETFKAKMNGITKARCIVLKKSPHSGLVIIQCRVDMVKSTESSWCQPLPVFKNECDVHIGSYNVHLSPQKFTDTTGLKGTLALCRTSVYTPRVNQYDDEWDKFITLLDAPTNGCDTCLGFAKTMRENASSQKDSKFIQLYKQKAYNKASNSQRSHIKVSHMDVNATQLQKLAPLFVAPASPVLIQQRRPLSGTNWIGSWCVARSS